MVRWSFGGQSLIKGVFLEDQRSGTEVVKILLGKAFGFSQQFVVRHVPRGDMLNQEKIRAHVQLFSRRFQDCSKLLICLDSHCNPAELQNRVADLQERLASFWPAPRYFIIAHAIESWLLADPSAIRTGLGAASELQINAISVQDHNPEETIKRLFSKQGRCYHKTADNKEIARHASLDALRQDCPNFQNFLDLLKDP